MININELIEKIYINTINIVLNGFEDNYLELVKRKYYESLKNQYTGLEIHIDDYEKTYETFLKFEIEEWLEKDLEEKKRIFLDDLSLNQIIDIASFAFKSANNRLNNNVLISKDYVEQLIDKLEQLDKNVLEFNKELSSWYLSECIMDLNYSCGNTNNTSLRIGHCR